MVATPEKEPKLEERQLGAADGCKLPLQHEKTERACAMTK
jgi:hypothetical protein